MTKHLLDIETLPSNAHLDILARANVLADQFEQNKPFEQTLKGKIIFSLFFENSTRTRMSFEIAAKRLGAEVINFATNTSSLKKDETYFDTLANLAAMRPDAVIMRHSDYNAPQFASNIFKCPIINAGDSYRAHPTQALLDALTIERSLGNIQGLNIAICGDIFHSRVARSNHELLTRLSANIRIIAPESLMPPMDEFIGATRYTNFEDGIKNTDIIMMLRLQKERMQSGLIKSDADYFNTFGLTQERLKIAKPNAIIMHPGPMNRGVEIADDAADDPIKSMILKQTAMGVPARMAVLEYALLD